jgi:hypothetical protein
VKDAKSEAQKEIEDYRSQKESEFKTFETEVSPTTEEASSLPDHFFDVHGLWEALYLGHQLTLNSTPAATRRPRRTHRRPPISSSRTSSRSATRLDQRYGDILYSYLCGRATDRKQVVEDLLQAVVSVNPEVPTRTEQPTV